MRAIDQRFEVTAFHKLRPFQYRHAPSLLETAALVITRDLQRLGGWRGGGGVVVIPQVSIQLLLIDILDPLDP